MKEKEKLILHQKHWLTLGNTFYCGFIRFDSSQKALKTNIQQIYYAAHKFALIQNLHTAQVDVRFEIEIIATAYIYIDKCSFHNEGHYIDFRPQVGLYNHKLPRPENKAFVWPNFLKC